MNQDSRAVEGNGKNESASASARPETKAGAGIAFNRNRRDFVIAADGLHYEIAGRRTRRAEFNDPNWTPPWQRQAAGPTARQTAPVVPCSHPTARLQEVSRQPIVRGDSAGLAGEIVVLRCGCGTTIRRETLGRLGAERESENALTPGWRAEIAGAMAAEAVPAAARANDEDSGCDAGCDA